jgi:L-rhamnose-H+ transport protein
MDLLIGLVLVFISGAMAGNVLTPIKLIRKYQFENYWLIFSFVGTVLIPWGLAFATIPSLFGVYRAVPASVLFLPPLFAFSWGIASTLGGLCVPRIGLSLTYALIVGMGASAGTLVPMLYFSPRALATVPGFVILFGIAIMIMGIIIVTKAGREKERREKLQRAEKAVESFKGVIQGTFIAGLLMAMLAGLLSAGLNFSFAFGQSISEAAVVAGASKNNATYAVWAIAMLGGMIPTLVFPLILCLKNNTWSNFTLSPGTDIPLSVLMGVMFMGSTALYGLGAVRLGVLGTSVGWGIMQIMQIVVGNIAGFLTGEWKIAGREAVTIMFWGLVVLILASCFMAYGNYLFTTNQMNL